MNRHLPLRNLPLRISAIAALAAAFAPHTMAAAGAATPSAGAQAGNWKTYVLSSGSDIAVPALPADNSDQTKAELNELRELQTLRGPTTNQVIAFWNTVPATQRWTDLTISLIPQEGVNPRRANRAEAIVHTAMYDAMVAAYHAKYQYNRQAPSAVASDITAAAVVPPDPSYPSEHAAIAAAAAGTLAYLFPDQAKMLAAMAQEAGEARLLAGTNYRSDVDAGMALGQAVAQKAIARAQADGSDAKFTGTIPTGAGIWNGTNPVEPLAGTWKPWLMTSGSQLRLGPPLAFGSPDYEAQLAEVKRINASVSPTERADAVFWGTMAGGIWLREADNLIARDGLSTPSAARILALVAAAEMDAVVAFSDTKYTYWTMRPFMADTTIQPIGSDNSPGYPSGVATDGTAAADVLAYFFPQDRDRLEYMAGQASMSRLDAGLHFPYDLDAGAQMGRSLAQLAVQHDALSNN
jgi:membrane-associated phospholipid phosphatase